MIMCPPPQKVFSFGRVPNERSIELCRYLSGFRPPGCIRSISIQPSGGTRGVEVPACLLIVNDDCYLCQQTVVEALHLSVALGLRQCGPGLYHPHLTGFLGHLVWKSDPGSTRSPPPSCRDTEDQKQYHVSTGAMCLKACIPGCNTPIGMSCPFIPGN